MGLPGCTDIQYRPGYPALAEAESRFPAWPPEFAPGARTQGLCPHIQGRPDLSPAPYFAAKTGPEWRKGRFLRRRRQKYPPARCARPAAHTAPPAPRAERHTPLRGHSRGRFRGGPFPQTPRAKHAPQARPAAASHRPPQGLSRARRGVPRRMRGCARAPRKTGSFPPDGKNSDSAACYFPFVFCENGQRPCCSICPAAKKQNPKARRAPFGPAL